MTKRGLNTRIARLAALKQERDEIDVAIKEVQAEIVQGLDDIQEKSLTVEVDGRNVRATKVEAVRTTIDEKSLKHSLGEKLWLKVSTRILDKKKLEAFIATGEVDAMVVAECSNESTTAPYIKLS